MIGFNMLIFKYGTMGSGKTVELLVKIFYERSKGNKVLVIKPYKDTRDTAIKSRIGLETEIDGNENYLFKFDWSQYQFIIVDEAQFLAPMYVDVLREFANKQNLTVVCYGLKSDFKTNLFAGSKRLLEIADKIEEIESTCKLCNNKAIYNGKFINDKLVTEGNPISIGGDETYKALCSKCYMKLLKQK